MSDPPGNHPHARKYSLPRFTLTELCDPDEKGAVAVVIPPSETTGGATYYHRSVVDPDGQRSDGRPSWAPKLIDHYPLVLHADGSLWTEANLYIFESVMSQPVANMVSWANVALDLAAFRRWLDEYGVDWTDFSVPNKFRQPTSRYNAWLNRLVQAGGSAAYRRRQQNSVLNFYRWAIQNGLSPQHAPWRERDAYINYTGDYGQQRNKRIIVTDLKIRGGVQNNPYSDYIDDGEKLRPLPMVEQEWLLDALNAIPNREARLMHLIALVTGARIQTVCTIRVRHVTPELGEGVNVLRLNVGRGTGIDTKRNKKFTLQLPAWLYQELHSYAHSPHASRRRQKAVGGDIPDQYLFLTQQAGPYYDARRPPAIRISRKPATGDSLRSYIRLIIAHVRKQHCEAANWRYRFHDLRATAGMNALEDMIRRGIPVGEACNFLMGFMAHDSLETTMRYLNYKGRSAIVRAANDGYGEYLRSLAQGGRAADHGG